MDRLIPATQESMGNLSQARMLMTQIAREVPVSSISPLDRALVLVAAADGLTLEELGRLLGVHADRAAELVAQLIQRGHAERHSRVDPKDRRRRASRIWSTAAGRASAVATGSTFGRAAGELDPVRVVLAAGRMRGVAERILVRLLGGDAAYDELRGASAAGERVVRQAVHGLRERGLVERVAGADWVGAHFTFRLTPAGQAAAERMVGQVELALRDLAIVPPRLGTRLENSSAPSATATGSAP